MNNQIMEDDLDIRFTYHAPSANQIERMVKLRETCKELARLIYTEPPPSREQSLALTHVEEVSMWANAAIARREA